MCESTESKRIILFKIEKRNSDNLIKNIQENFKHNKIIYTDISNVIKIIK